MAADTIGVSALERAAGVAPITAHARVCAIQIEAGAEVIERLLRTCDRRQEQRNNKPTI